MCCISERRTPILRSCQKLCLFFSAPHEFHARLQGCTDRDKIAIPKHQLSSDGTLLHCQIPSVLSLSGQLKKNKSFESALLIFLHLILQKSLIAFDCENRQRHQGAFL